MDFDSNSSNSSSLGVFEYMVNDYVEWNESITQRRKEDELIEEATNSAVVPLVTSSFQVPSTHAVKKKRFRMRKHVFQRIVTKLSERDVYFQQRPDATGRLGASALQKCTAAIRMLAYGSAADAVDKYLKIAASTARECLGHFFEGVISNFGQEYLRRVTPTDVKRLLRESNVRGFSDMLGSIDCMHWEWKNYPRAWNGMYQGRSKTTTIILEAVASQHLWIWHAFFGTPGSLNDINVL
ncbi:uncharacterized protein LOC110711546 [Chenopodium quinoa]|uniref:uncharacterized protein LOC110711546 n=1 Tax=Chenopodium quinoa TaxID=63459 RepID=UPI000B797C75|nr:uncharacterized protein LOC110711546 [Chenopodium quinoa]